MPLQYDPNWKFEGFQHAIPIEAHQAFGNLVEMMAEGADRPKSIYEDFKSAYGVSAVSTGESWALTDMHKAMRGAMDNAARYVASFYSGMESVKKRGIAVPSVKKLNQILVEHEVPLKVEPPHLLLRKGDIDFVPEDVSEEALATAFVRGPVIGRGGFGTVYKVTRKTKLGEFEFAMKVLEPSIGVENKERANKRFIRELRTLKKLQHRAIVQVIEAGITPEQNPYILMPFIEGEDVRLALSGKKPRTIYEVFIEIARGLAFAHKVGAIHRDLKPSNILVRTADRQPFILDFGCAYLIDEVDETLTTTLIGTPGYIPREVMEDPSHRDPRQDLYAVGVMLYEVIASCRPKVDKYEPIEKDFPQFEGVDDLIRELLAPEDDRVADAATLRRKLSILNV